MSSLTQSWQDDERPEDKNQKRRTISVVGQYFFFIVGR